MKQFYIKQQLFSVAEKFTVTDSENNVQYYVTGSLFNAQKNFEIRNTADDLVAKITKRVLAFLPKFIVETHNNETVEIKKDLSLLRPHYTFTPQNISVQGDIFEMNFSILNNKEEIATIQKKLFSFGDAYEITILDTKEGQYSGANEILVVALTITIDYMISQKQAG